MLAKNIFLPPISLPILIVGLVLFGNLLIVARDVSLRVRQDLYGQLYTLLREAGQLIDTNSSIIDSLVTNIELELKNQSNIDAISSKGKGALNNGLSEHLEHIFTKNTAKIKRYTNSVIFLTNARHKIIAASDGHPIPYQSDIVSSDDDCNGGCYIDSEDSNDCYCGIDSDCDSNVDLGQRHYIQLTVAEPKDLHIGDLEEGVISKVWSVPLAKAILGQNDRYIGAIVSSIPLSKFSENVFSSYVDLSSIMVIPAASAKDANSTSKQVGDAGEANQGYIDSIISKSFVIKAAFTEPFIVHIVGTIDNLGSEIIFAVRSLSISQVFWAQYLNHSLIASLLIAFIMGGILWIKRKILNPLSSIMDKLIHPIQNLRSLIPEYRGYSTIPSDSSGLSAGEQRSSHQYTDQYNASLKAIEGFVLESHVVTTALHKQKETIEDKNRQISILKRNFAACMRSVEESAECLSENINDAIDNVILYNRAISTIMSKTATAEALMATLEQIYGYSKDHKAYVASLKDTISKAIDITQLPRISIDIEAILHENLENKCKTITRHNKDDNLGSHSKTLFYPEALGSVLQSLLSAFDDRSRLSVEIVGDGAETRIAGDLVIEFVYDISAPEHEKNHIDNTKLHSAIEKARIFALLDEGIISLYNGADSIVVTVIYEKRYDQDNLQS